MAERVRAWHWHSVCSFVISWFIGRATDATRAAFVGYAELARFDAGLGLLDLSLDLSAVSSNAIVQAF